MEPDDGCLMAGLQVVAGLVLFFYGIYRLIRYVDLVNGLLLIGVGLLLLGD